jgi:CspA family cold shock protein
MTTETGTVKWFNDAKGFGFIAPDNGGKDLFAHFKEIQGTGFKKLAENDRVEFEVAQGAKGPQATRIRVICLPASVGRANGRWSVHDPGVMTAFSPSLSRVALRAVRGLLMRSTRPRMMNPLRPHRRRDHGVDPGTQFLMGSQRPAPSRAALPTSRTPARAPA